MIVWLPEAELQRDSIHLELQGKPLLRFEQALGAALEQIGEFPESGRMHPLGGGRGDLREVVFGGGYRLVYGVVNADFLVVISLLPPRSGQALD